MTARVLSTLLLSATTAAVVTSCAAIGGLGDFKEVACVGAACDGGTDDSDAADANDIDGDASTFEFASVGGTVSGLLGKGLILKDNLADDLQVAKDGPFVFPAKVRDGDPYDVTIGAQPSEPTQSCMVTKGTGVVHGANVADVTVTCTTSAFVLRGNVLGAVGTGLVLTNGGEDLPVTTTGPFAFSTRVVSGVTYDVSIKTQPTGAGPCVVSGGSGTVGVADVSTVVVNCTPATYTVGGTTSGLSGTVVLQNGATSAQVTSNGTFALAAAITQGQPYAVTVQTQPGYPPRAQTCTVANGTGSMPAGNVTNVAVTCTTNTYAVGGSISGLGGTIVLQNAGADDLSITADGTFTFKTPIASGNAFTVTVAAQPAGQTCSVSNGAGTVTSAAVTNVSVTCPAAGSDPGVKCGDTAFCDPASQICCVTNGSPSCATRCAGAGQQAFHCDDAQDCAAAGQPSSVCCGNATGGVVTTSYCTQANLCTAPKAYFCDPNVGDPCPNGGTCGPATSPAGWFRCF